MARTTSYKNFWSLNLDEAIAAGQLRANLNNGLEVLMPLNAQMKDIDLVVINTQSKKCVSIQVKGSRAYEPKEGEKVNFGEEGSTGWFAISQKAIERCIADYFLFLVYVIESHQSRAEIMPHTILIPTDKLRRLVKTHKKPNSNGIYNFYFHINWKTKVALDHRNKPPYRVSEYLDEKGFRELNKKLI